MKGFYIEITNNLLDPKHRKAMGEAVWLFMFFLDKMTSIDDKGVGKILGGKPIKFQHISEELGISERTYSRWISCLKKYGYIGVRRTPYGLVITLNKAKKRYAKSGGYKPSDTPKVAGKISQSGGNKEDTTVDINNKTVSAGAEVNEFIKLFEEINPSYADLFKRPVEREAMKWLLDRYGPEKCRGMILALPEIISKPYAPRITTPRQLKENLGKLLAFYKQEKNKTVAKTKAAIIT
jgi:hypothetical protein